MKPKSERKLQEWIENAKRKGLDPGDIKLYINEDWKPEFRPEPQAA